MTPIFVPVVPGMTGTDVCCTDDLLYFACCGLFFETFFLDARAACPTMTFFLVGKLFGKDHRRPPGFYLHHLEDENSVEA